MPKFPRPHLGSGAAALLLAGLLAPLSAAAAERAPDLTLWYDQPATSAMNEALPIGNGRLGAMVFGGTARERLQFNEDSLWTGDANPSGAYDTMGAYQAFGDLLLRTGDAAAAQATCPSGQLPFTPAEGVAAASDGDPATKWCVDHGGNPVVWQVPAPAGAPAPASYALTSANDVPERDPRAWELAGSNDGRTWTTLDRRSGEPPWAQRHQERRFAIAHPQAFRTYRLVFAPNADVPKFQIAEIALDGLRTAAAPTAHAGAPADGYRRELDLATAVARTDFVLAGVHHRREAFASHHDDALIVRWSAREAHAVTGTIALAGAHGERSAATGTAVAFAGALPNGLRYAALAQVIAHGGTAQVVGDAIAVAGCDDVEVILTARTDYAMDHARGYRSGEDPQAALAARSAALAARPYAELLADHLADHRALFARVALDLGGATPEQRAMPTAQRKARAAQVCDPGLEALLFQYGRYLLIGCSRPGGLPANLQGLWNDSNDPAWHCDYHANINIQMNYWPAETTNLAECQLPFFALIASQLEPWRAATAASRDLLTAAGAPAARGFALRTSHNIMGGMGWNWDKTASAWYCQHLWEHYAFSGDRAFLAATAYPLLKEVSGFWQDHLKALPDGRLVVPDAWSPEHGPVEDGVAYSQEIVWDLFTNCAEASAALGVDAAYRQELLALRDRLAVPGVGSWGQLLEWLTEKKGSELDTRGDHHRHTSHLFAVFPGRQISVARTPELARAAKVSLDARGAEGDVREWSFAWRTALYARLRDGEQAHAMLQQLFADRNTCANLLGLHPPMQMDGDFGITAGVAEMLVQSHEGAIALLPALPAAWPAGAVSGLRARGGFVLDLVWAGGALRSVTVRSANGGECALRCGAAQRTVVVPAGGSVVVAAPL